MARGSRSDDYDYDYDTDHDDNDDAFSSSDDDELYDIEADTDHASGDNDTREPREAWLDRLHSSLKGRTTGRRLKRELFRSAALSLFGSLLLILLSIAAGTFTPMKFHAVVKRHTQAYWVFAMLECCHQAYCTRTLDGMDRRSQVQLS